MNGWDRSKFIVLKQLAAGASDSLFTLANFHANEYVSFQEPDCACATYSCKYAGGTGVSPGLFTRK